VAPVGGKHCCLSVETGFPVREGWGFLLPFLQWNIGSGFQLKTKKDTVG